MVGECAKCGVVARGVGNCDFLKSNFQASWKCYEKEKYVARDGKTKERQIEQKKRGLFYSDNLLAVNIYECMPDDCMILCLMEYFSIYICVP